MLDLPDEGLISLVEAAVSRNVDDMDSAKDSAHDTVPSRPSPTLWATVVLDFPASSSNERSLSAGEVVQVEPCVIDGYALCLSEDGNRGIVPLYHLEFHSVAKINSGWQGM
jgi:hypothetical protein